MEISILLIDDEKELVEELSEILELLSCKTKIAYNGKEGLDYLSKQDFDLVITDVEMPIMDGFEFITEARKNKYDVPILVITGHAAVDYGINAVKVGADDFVLKPLNKDILQFHIEKALERKKNEQFAKAYIGDIEKGYSFDGIISIDRNMQEIFEQIKIVANLDITVMITGESGCGKELVARSIHKRSNRAKGPFMAINSGSLPRELVASELFGHIKGSFTGAYTNKIGKFEEAKGGTLFLDELLTMDENTQISLLRVLETGEFYKIGSNTSIMADVRIITATNADVEKAILEEKFREDLYHRLNVFSIKLPPLRERHDDIELLTRHFIKLFSIKLKLPEVPITEDVIEYLKVYRWPGNIRELRNVIQRSLILSSGLPITVKHLPESITRNIIKANPVDSKQKQNVQEHKQEDIPNIEINVEDKNAKVDVHNDIPYTIDNYDLHNQLNSNKIEINLDMNYKDIEKMIIEAQLLRCYGNKKVVSEKLGISRKALYSKIKKYNIQDIRKK